MNCRGERMFKSLEELAKSENRTALKGGSRSARVNLIERNALDRQFNFLDIK